MENNYINLEPSEQAVFQGAIRMYCVYLSNDRVNAANEAEIMEKCVRDSLKIAQRTDQLVMSDNEMS